MAVLSRAPKPRHFTPDKRKDGVQAKSGMIECGCCGCENDALAKLQQLAWIAYLAPPSPENSANRNINELALCARFMLPFNIKSERKENIAASSPALVICGRKENAMSLSDHSAAGSNAGFSFQFERAMLWLAQSPAGCVVGIETDDDVAVCGPDGSRVLEQDKHSVRDNAGPFGDRSKDLWKTLAIWIEALDNDEVNAETALFLMVTNKTLQECIAHKINRAHDQEEITACITHLEAAANEPPEKVAKLMKRVLDPGSRANLRKLIPRCQLADGSRATAGGDLRKQTLSRLQLPQRCSSSADSIMDELLGWLHSTALAAWQQGKPAWIQRDHFVNQLYAIIDRRKRQISRERAEHLIPVTSDKIGQEKARPFVKQLHLVTDDDTLVNNAIREFIRCNIEKSRLSAQGDVTDDDWKAFETTLLSRWEKIRGRVIRVRRAAKEEDIGFEIFTDTTENHREKLAGSETEQVYLTSGTYHRLADMVRVGWHPRFKELMRKLTEAP